MLVKQTTRGGNRMKSVIAVSLIALGVAALGGCATGTTTQPATETTSTTATPSPVANADSAPSKSMGSQPVYRVVRFPFDSSALDDANRKIVEEHARYLASNPNAKILIEGHADERGTREYNLALGERRAQAVAKILRVSGVSADRIETRSWGEERPAAQGHDETAWAQNRRDEFSYGK
jgi:peptidoglycan-associated lipoprotein